MGTLDTIEVTTGEQPQAAVIWLHGLGASGHDFEPVVPHLGLPASLPVRFVFPNAPSIPVTINNGMVMPAWYDIQSLALERELDENQLLASARSTAELIHREIERGIDSRQIVLAGFSQGGAVAYHCALEFNQPLGGLMALSTYFATAGIVKPHPANAGLPIHVFHGTEDPMVPEVLGRQATETLREMGYEPAWRSYPMGHEVCLEEINDIGAWLRQQLLPREQGA